MATESRSRLGRLLSEVTPGDLSAPILESLGFERHGEVRLYVDRL